MKILLIIDDITTFGGAERVCINLANVFSTVRLDSSEYFCGGRGGGKPQIEILSIKHFNINKDIPYRLNSDIRVIYYYDLYNFPFHKDDIKVIKKCYKKFYIKLRVFLYKLKFLIKFRLIGTSEVLKRISSLAISQNQYDFVIDNTWCDFYPFHKNTNTKYIYLEHISYYRKSKLMKKKYFESLKNFDIIVLLTTKERDIWQRYHSNIKVIPNFLPTIPQVATNHSQKVVLSVGRMDNGDQKGFLRLLDIWKMVQTKIKDSPSLAEGEIEDLSQWKLIIVGDGVLKGEIESKIRALNLQDSVILKPFTKDIEREYLGASIYAMASHFEGFPMVLLESTAYGLAPISFDIATGPSDIIEHNKSGFLIADNDLESYADKLIALMSDESMRIAFGNEAKKIVNENFSKEVIMQKWREVFEG